ncbi:secretory protein [Mucilaginibacter sp. JRF]|uniref:basic secretory protein-like protein n=1 Tax=Mucilaginibacter sp. JRF TaxID=2780088 RepID=UPI00188039F6|nr:basic secretory protein-like protein [Mucilaginibacter sp. JRF]MBE9583200.1 secretory protein [Mucilaginibacter sp. JRF]
MKKIILLALSVMIFASANSFAGGIDTLKKNGYTLIVSGNDENFDKELTQKLINTFFIVYPKLSKEYNKNTDKVVTFFIDTAYHGVAATGDGKVVFSAEYMTKHKTDIDVVTHEVMHIVQGYGETNGPWWVTEGIADYARYKFGIANAAGNWTLPEYKATQKYDNSYRITARFLAWIEAKVKKGTVKKLDDVMRRHAYNDNTWKDITGYSVEDLWKKYSENPAI